MKPLRDPRGRGFLLRLGILTLAVLSAVALWGPSASAAQLTTRAGVMQPTAAATSGAAYVAMAPSRLLDTRVTGQTLGAGSSLSLTVTGNSVPASATAVALNVTVTDASTASYLSVYPAGGTQPLVSSLNWVGGETVANLVVVPVGTGGQVTFFNYAGSVDVVVDLQGYFVPEAAGSEAGSYLALLPRRITDTRPGSGEPYSGQTLTPGGTLMVQVDGEGGVPSSGVAAVLMNVTVTDTTGSGFLTAYPGGGQPGSSSTLNWTAGETVANRVLVPVGSDGQVSLYNSAGATDVVVDVNGYFSNLSTAPNGASLFNALSPVRVLDTRVNSDPLGPGQSLSQQLSGIDGIAANATAVVANVTATDTTANSYLTVYPGPGLPDTSDVNWSQGRASANLTVATLGSSGAISIYNRAGTADVIVDVFGYFSLIPPATSGSYGWVSSNWSGYKVEGGPFTSASGTFTVPTLSPTSGPTFMAAWVGIDGFKNQDLIQAGVQMSYNPTTNLASASPWWEILPAPETDINMAVAPGNQVTVTLLEVSGSLWDITVANDSSGQSFSTQQTYNGYLESAEWIMEAPQQNGSQSQLADYGSTSFSALTANGVNPGLTISDGGYMIQNGSVVSIPSAPGPVENSFNVSYGASAPAAP